MNENEAIRSTYEWHFIIKHARPFSTPFLSQLLRERINDETVERSDFSENLKRAAFHAIDHGEVVLTRQALHAIAFVGQLEDIPRLNALLEHPDPLVVRDVKTCLFEIRRRK